MSKVYDELNEMTNGWLGVVRATAVDIGTTVGGAAKRTARRTKVRADQLRLQRKLRDVCAQLGEAVYEQTVNGTEFEGKDEMVEMITSIKQTLADLAESVED